MIELLKKDVEPIITMDKLKDYGKFIIKPLQENRDIFFILDVNTLSNLFNNFSKYFDKEIINNSECITLKGMCSINDLEDNFMDYLPSDIYYTLINYPFMKQ
jgi:hypothetical protein